MVINNTIFNVELIDIVDELVSQLRINNINYLSKTKETSTHIQVTCPYHNNGQERRPSAGIRKSDGKFHCFACGEVHELPEVISYCFGYVDDILGKFGWDWLLRNFAVVQVEERKDVGLDFTRGADRIGNKGINSSRSRHNYVSVEELETYRYLHPYMYKRGLTDEVIEMFDIGYDAATESITFPVKDIYGNCLFVARRSVKTKWFNYPEGVEKPLYGLYECLKFQYNKGGLSEVIVTESMLDALSFWTIGKCAVALNGLGNELQFKQLRELPCRKIILATDNDSAGQKARQRIRLNLQNTKLVTEYIFPKGRKDANDCTKEELENLLEIF